MVNNNSIEKLVVEAVRLGNGENWMIYEYVKSKRISKPRNSTIRARLCELKKDGILSSPKNGTWKMS